MPFLRRYSQRSFFKALRAVALLCLLAVPLGCAVRPWQGFPASGVSSLVWPPPPEPARVAYVMQIKSHADLFETAGFWHGVGELLGGKPDSTLVRPYAVAVHPAGGLLIADPGRPGVHFYDWTRRRYVAIGPQHPGGLPSPVGVAGLADGRILVSDSRLQSVEVFAADGHYQGPFCAAGTLLRPAGIVVDEARDRVYIADVAAHGVRVFDLKGALLRTIGSHGAAPGQFNYPTHLALDNEGRLVVADSLNFRIEILQPLKPDAPFVASFGGLGDAPGQFSKPKGVAVDAAGNIIVVEALYGALQFFDSQRRFLLSLGASGHGPGQFWLPAGLCCDRPQGLLFVADSYNKRVQVFRLLPGTAPPDASATPPISDTRKR